MPVERSARVLAVDHDGVRLALVAGCSGCSGCAGRCDLGRLLRADGDAVRLPTGWFAAPVRVGQKVTLCFDGGTLAATALRGYGRPLSGLLAGCALGAALAAAFGWPLNPWVFGGAIAGTFAGSMRSNPRHAIPAGFRIE